MRYEKGHKAATRERIMEVAGRRFRDDGIAAVGLAGVMSDADLTNGAFYAHFASKEDLVMHVLERELQRQQTAFAETMAGPAELEDVIRAYLSTAHRDNRASGCPSAALLDEIGRRPAATRDAYTTRLLEVIDIVAAHIDRDDPNDARLDALAAFASMVGTLQIARAVSDPQLSSDILDRGVQAAMAVIHGRAASRT